MDPQYVQLVKEWVKLDNIILLNNTEAKVIKDNAKQIEERVNETNEKKKNVEKQIIEYVQTNKLESMQLKISDGVITFSKKTTQKPLNQKFLKEVLEKYAEENPSEAINYNKIFEYVVSNIDKKVEYSINRNLKPTTASTSTNIESFL